MGFKAIIAVDDNNVMGVNNDLPWPRNQLDMDWFRNNTLHSNIYMGSKTYESIGGKPLPKRDNYVITSDPSRYRGQEEVNALSLKELRTKVLFDRGYVEDWIIGGPNILKQTINDIDEFYISIIEHDTEIKDTDEVVRIPLDYWLLDFKLKWSRDHKGVRFERWVRKG